MPSSNGKQEEIDQGMVNTPMDKVFKVICCFVHIDTFFLFLNQIGLNK